MPLHIRFDLAAEIKNVGVLALIGFTEQRAEGKTPEKPGEFPGWETVVSFVLQARADGKLTPFFVASYPFQPEGGLLESFINEGKQWVVAPDDKSSFLFFERKVEGRLREPSKYLHATADKLAKELLYEEEAELASR